MASTHVGREGSVVARRKVGEVVAQDHVRQDVGGEGWAEEDFLIGWWGVWWRGGTVRKRMVWARRMRLGESIV